MHDPKRIDQVLDAIRLVWNKYPDRRLGQVLSGAAVGVGWHDTDLFYLEDDKLLQGLIEYDAAY